MIKIYAGETRLEISGEVSIRIDGTEVHIIQKASSPNHSPYVIQPKPVAQEQNQQSFYDDNPSYMNEGDYLKSDDYLKLDIQSAERPLHKSVIDSSPAMQKHLREGATTLRGLVETWSENLGQTGTPQPDRQKALLECLEDNGTAMLSYIDSCGGITKSILNCWEGSEDTAREIAMNMAQVSSILYPPLSHKLELFYKKTS